MGHFVVRRFLQLIPILFGVSVLLFTILQVAPGGPEAMLLGEEMSLDPASLQDLRRSLGLDRPIHIQYVSWVTSFFTQGMGRSYATGGTVGSIIWGRLPRTVLLTFSAWLLAILFAMPIGVISAVRKNGLFDTVFTTGAFFGISFPNFWLGLMLMLFFAYYLRWFPMGGFAARGREYDFISRVHHMVLPVVTLTAGQTAIFVRFIRSSMLEVLDQDYIRTARAKGLPERKVIFKHALRNGLLAPITLFGSSIRHLVGGAALVETVFFWPGLGLLTVSAISRGDFPVIMGVVLVISVGIVVGNLLADVLYAVADPRIRYD